MNTKKRTLAAAVVALLLLVTQLCACAPKSDEELIRDRIDSFMSDYNDGDLDEALENLTTKTKTATQAILSMAESFGSMLGMEISLSDMFTLGIAITGDDTLKVTIDSVTIEDETNATADGKLSLGGIEEYDIRFVMLKEDGDWYIDNMVQE